VQAISSRYLLIVKKFRDDSFIFFAVIKKVRPRAKMKHFYTDTKLTR